jgi:hypothetical protein
MLDTSALTESSSARKHTNFSPTRTSGTSRLVPLQVSAVINKNKEVTVILQTRSVEAAIAVSYVGARADKENGKESQAIPLRRMVPDAKQTHPSHHLATLHAIAAPLTGPTPKTSTVVSRGWRWRQYTGQEEIAPTLQRPNKQAS